MTKIINFKDGIQKWELEEIKKTFMDGKLVIFPTETVYGIGANALDKTAVDSIFVAKGRAQDNPLIVHISNFSMLKDLVEEPNEIEQKLIDALMPGPFTIILKKKKGVIPDNVTCGLDTVGIRFPENKIIQSIIEYTGLPIAAPSANISSKPSGTNIEDIKDEFDGKVDIIVDGGETLIGLESTVCKVIDGVPTILRPGFITKEDIEMVIGSCNVSEFVMKEAKGRVESPGMLYKHYSPNTKCILVDKELMEEVSKKYTNPIIIGSNEINRYKYFDYGDNLVNIAHNIFKLLREADKLNGEVILIEAVEPNGLGLAIMNRLIRTCEYNYIKRENENK